MVPVVLDNFPFESNEHFDEELECVVEGDSAEVSSEQEIPPKKISNSTSQLRPRDTQTQQFIDQRFKCLECHYLDNNFLSFLDHLVSHASTVVQCLFCSFEARPRTMKLHMLKHQAVEALTCSLCEFHSPDGSLMANHFEVYHTKIYQCSQCPKLMTKHVLIEHCKTDHDEKLISDTNKMKVEQLNYTDGELDEIHTISEQLKPECDCVMDYCHTVDKSETEENVDNVDERFDCFYCDFSSECDFSLSHKRDEHTEKCINSNISAVMVKNESPSHASGAHRMKTTSPTRELHEFDYDSDVSRNSEQIGDESLPQMYSTERSLSGSEEKIVDIAESGFELHGCSFCGFRTPLKVIIKYHVLLSHFIKKRCMYCFVVMTKYSLIKHLEDNHGVKSYQKNELIHPESTTQRMIQNPKVSRECDKQNGIEKSPLFCPICNFSAVVESAMKTHWETSHPNKGNILTDSLTKNKFLETSERETGGDGASDGTELCLGDSLNETVSSNVLPNDEKHKREDNFVCNLCKFTTKYKKSSVMHFDLLHSKKFWCNYCSAIMSKYELIKHLKDIHDITIHLHGGRSYKFREVSHDFGEAKKRNQLSEDSSDKPRPSLKLRQLNKPEVCGEETSQQEQNTDDSIKKCTICSFCTKYDGNLSRHMEQLHFKKYLCNYCSSVMTKYDLIKHCKDIHEVKLRSTKFLYSVCDDDGYQDLREPRDDEGFSNSLHVHEPGTSFEGTETPRSGQKTFNCSLCDFSTLYPYNVAPHVEKLHSIKYHCSHCPEVMTKHALIEHVTKEHGVVVTFHTKFTVAADDNNASKAVKTSENPSCNVEGKSVDCTTCGYSVISKKALSSHMKNLHSRLYQCFYCPSVMTKYDLICHSKKVHDVAIGLKNRYLVEIDGSRNDVCESDVVESAALKTPQSSSVPDTPVSVGGRGKHTFHCSKCEFSTTSRFNLQSHMRNLHIKMYHCNLCPIIMTKHEIINHSKEEHGVIVHVKRSFFKPADGPEEGAERKAPDVTDMISANEVEPFPEQDKYELSPRQTQKTFTCKECKFSSFKKPLLDRHMKRFHRIKYSCSHCQAVMTKCDLVNHYKKVHGIVMKVWSMKSLLRPKKSKIIASSKNTERLGPEDNKVLRDIKAQGIRGNRFKCPKCKFASPYRVSLLRHETTMHSTRHACQHCSVVLTKYALSQHYKKVHGLIIKPRGRKSVGESAGPIVDGSGTGNDKLIGNDESCSIKRKSESSVVALLSNVVKFVNQPVIKVKRLKVDVDGENVERLEN